MDPRDPGFCEQAILHRLLLSCEPLQNLLYILAYIHTRSLGAPPGPDFYEAALWAGCEPFVPA